MSYTLLAKVHFFLRNFYHLLIFGDQIMLAFPIRDILKARQYQHFDYFADHLIHQTFLQEILTKGTIITLANKIHFVLSSQ